MMASKKAMENKYSRLLWEDFDAEGPTERQVSKLYVAARDLRTVMEKQASYLGRQLAFESRWRAEALTHRRAIKALALRAGGEIYVSMEEMLAANEVKLDIDHHLAGTGYRIAEEWIQAERAHDAAAD